MKIALIFLATMAVLVTAKQELTKEQEEKILENYFTKFPSRGGRSSANQEKRRKNVLKKFKQVEDHNERFKNGWEAFEQELNEFSQLDDEELKKLSGFELPKDYKVDKNQTWPPSINGERGGRANVPKYHNWADVQGVVQPVQNQGQCSSCYVFAAIGAMEGSMCRYYEQCTKLSEQEAMECTNNCNNGWDDYVYDYSRDKFGGCAYAGNYYYSASPRSSCAAHGSRVPKSRVTSYVVLNDLSAEALKNFIFQYGPVFAAYNLYVPFFSYKSGVYTACSGQGSGGHAVLITGFGEENGYKYWIAKNSWGTGFGQGGYFKILRGSNACNIEKWKVSFPWTQ